MPGNPLVRFDEGRVGRTFGVALSPTLPVQRCRHRPARTDSLFLESEHTPHDPVTQ